MWKATFIFIARFGGGGLVGYAAPRFLIASGVPLDTWIKYLAYKFKDASAWINYDSIYWVLVLIIGLFVISLTYLIPYFLSKQKQEKVAEIIESPPKKKETSETDDLRGIWLSEAVLYAGGLGWNPQLAEQVPTTSEINAAYKGLEMIIQAALDGDLIIYGRDGFAGPLKPIPSEYWGKFGVNALHVLSKTQHELTTELKRGTWGNDGVKRNLRTSKKKAEELWPYINGQAAFDLTAEQDRLEKEIRRYGLMNPKIPTEIAFQKQQLSELQKQLAEINLKLDSVGKGPMSALYCHLNWSTQHMH